MDEKQAAATLSPRKHAGYAGPWKMTFASSEPEVAHAFVLKYLGASHLETR